MGSPLLVLQHIACEPPAAFEDELRSRGLDLVRVELDEGEPPPDWRGFPAIVVMGGPMGAYDEADHPWLVDEKRLLREAVEADVPVWGVCLGAQLLASALGARVYRGERPEVGLLPVELTPAAAETRSSATHRAPSPRSSGMATASTCRTARPCSRAHLPTDTRRSGSAVPTGSSSTSRSRLSWPRVGRGACLRREPRGDARPRRSRAPAGGVEGNADVRCPSPGRCSDAGSRPRRPTGAGSPSTVS